MCQALAHYLHCNGLVIDGESRSRPNIKPVYIVRPRTVAEGLQSSDQFRYRKLEQPAKYDGERCVAELWESIACPSTEKCTPPTNCGKDFQCKMSGRCIKQEFVGNGDKDCMDGSDEDNYEEDGSKPVSVCKELFPIPGAENVVLGFNILTQSEGHKVLDHEYFGGQCEMVYNGEWRDLRYDPVCEQMYYGDDEKYFRKPYNFHTYQFLMRADTRMAFESYDSAYDVLKAIGRETSFSFSYEPSIRPAGVPVGVGYGIGVEHGNEYLKNISTYTAKNLQFFRLSTKIQTARFRMRRSSLMLNEDMLIALRELPDTYNYGPYSKFLATYGTHFVTSGTIGGTLEHVMVLDKDEMRKQDITYEKTKTCFNGYVGIKLAYDKAGLDGDLRLKYKPCNTLETDMDEKGGHSKIIKDVLTNAKGGDPPSTGALTNIFDGVTFRMWGRSLRYNPAVIESELLPIYELLKLADVSGIEKKRENLKTAYYEFLNEFHSCRCGPCENNGLPVLDNNVCTCECPQGFEGVACETTRRTA
ncbi:complement component C8 alpha chain [Gastrophryne carolinensis]